jgi:hypothetical protein
LATEDKRERNMLCNLRNAREWPVTARPICLSPDSDQSDLDSDQSDLDSDRGDLRSHPSNLNSDRCGAYSDHSDRYLDCFDPSTDRL